MPLLKRSFFYFVLCLIVWTAFVFYVRDKYTVPILMYHQVGGSMTLDGELNTVSKRSFERQIKYLKKHGYHVISLDDLVLGINQGVQFSRNSVVITFDDGYEDNYSNAYPVLKKYGFPATIFMVSGQVGKEGYLTWPQLKEMLANRIAISSHTKTHRYLPDVKNKDEVWDEVAGSKKELEAGLGTEVKYFSYPSGGYSEEIKEAVMQAHYQGACATNRGYDRFNTGTFELKRIRVNETDSAVVLWAKLSGYYNLFRDFKNTY